MAHIPRQRFSKSVQQSLAHIPRQILARFSRRPYSSLLARFPRGRTAVSAQISRQQRGCFIWHEFRGRPYSKWLYRCTEIEADSVQQFSAVFWHKFRGPYSSIYCCFAQISRWLYRCIYCRFLGTKNEEIRTAFIAVPVLLFAHFPRRWLSTENEISCKSLLADFLLNISLTVKSIFQK